jgi:hypothetical protein
MYQSESKHLNRFAAIVTPDKAKSDKAGVQTVERLFPLGPDEVATFQLLSRPQDPDNPGRLRLPFITFIKPVQRIVDPTSKDLRYISLGNVNQEYSDEAGHLITKTPHPAFFASTQGVKVLHGNRESEVNEYHFLCLCNENASNENRDENVVPVFEQVVAKKVAVTERMERNVRIESLNKARTMSDAETREFAASMGWNSKEVIDILRNQVEQYAEDDPAEFKLRAEDANRALRANVKMALDENIISYQPENKRFVFVADKSVVFAYPTRIEGTQFVDRLSEFFISNKTESKKIYETTVSRLKAKLDMVATGEIV